MRRGAAAGLLGVVLLAGCGGDPQDARRDAYCDALRAQQETFGDMANSQDPAVLIDQLPTLQGLGDKAPKDLADEWQTFLNALEGLEVALEKADVQPGEFGPGKVPADLTVADAKAISDAADVLSSQQVLDAAEGIEQQARDVCHVQLGL